VRLAIPDLFLEITIEARQSPLSQQTFLGHELLAGPRQKPVFRTSVALPARRRRTIRTTGVFVRASFLDAPQPEWYIALPSL
jgi:hypothetical protein